jgi:hypothetical protein
MTYLGLGGGSGHEERIPVAGTGSNRGLLCTQSCIIKTSRSALRSPFLNTAITNANTVTDTNIEINRSLPKKKVEMK